MEDIAILRKKNIVMKEKDNRYYILSVVKDFICHGISDDYPRKNRISK